MGLSGPGGIYPKERFFSGKHVGRGQEEFGEEEQFLEKATAMAERVRIPIGTAMNLAVWNPNWTGGLIGETVYVYTLCILKRMGGDSAGGKINREVLAAAELEIPHGGKGEAGKPYPYLHCGQ